MDTLLPSILPQLREMPLFQNSLTEWLMALVVSLVVLAVLLSLRRLIRRQHARLQASPGTDLLEIPVEILSRTTLAFFVVLGVFAGLSTLDMSDRMRVVVESVLMTVLFVQLGLWLSAAVLAWLERRKRRRETLADRAVVGSLGIIGFVARVLIWSVVGLLILDNLGIDVTALVAGLGIGGIAVALAAQNILGDLFASLSIAFDKPFLVGDFLIIDDYLGSVEHIGIKSTRLRSLSGEQIVISNADLLKSRVRNYGRMAERRIVMTHRVAYGTPLEIVRQIPGIIREAITKQDRTRFDRAHFAKHGDYALEFESVYYVLSPDYGVYMDIQQAINVEIHERFEALGIEFALPTRKLRVMTEERPEAQSGE